MKGKVMSADEAQTQEELQNSTAVTKETVTEQQGSQQRSFGSIDLWHRHRQMKTASGFLRRREFN